MAAYFCDSSAIVKRYLQETGTAWVRRLTRRGNPDPIYLARIAAVEVTSAVARRRRGGQLAVPRARNILTRFRVALLKMTPAITGRQLAQRIGISEHGIKYHLNKLKSKGAIRHVGSTKAGHWEVLK